MTAVYRNPIAIEAAKRHRIEAARAARKAGLPTKAQPVPLATPPLDRKAIKAELLAELDLPGRDQAVADAVVKHYEREILPKRDLEVAQAVDADNRQRAAAKAALAADVPTSVKVVHRDDAGRIAYVTEHLVTSTTDLEDLTE